MIYRIGVVFGGKSVEHEVSIISALQMMENMDRSIYDPIPIYLSKDNQFYYHKNLSQIESFHNIEQLKKDSFKVTFEREQNQLFIKTTKKMKKLFSVDVIFLIVHGTGCEDGTLSAYFDLLDVPYVGSTLLSSAINQNKWKMKQLFQQNKLPIVPYIGFYETDFDHKEKEILSRCEQLGYPLIVKPASLGSSIGIKKCNDEEGLREAILGAIQYDSEIVVEKVITHLIELNCSVLGNMEHLEASSVERVIQQDEILSYEDKYLRHDKGGSKGMASTRRVLPADISPELTLEVQTLAVKSIEIVGGSGVSRIDFIVDKDSNQLYINEINTIPGSLSFYLWADKGVSYSELISRLIKIALKNYQRKNSKITSYDTNILSLPKGFNKGKL